MLRVSLVFALLGLAVPDAGAQVFKPRGKSGPVAKAAQARKAPAKSPTRTAVTAPSTTPRKATAAKPIKKAPPKKKKPADEDTLVIDDDDDEVVVED